MMSAVAAVDHNIKQQFCQFVINVMLASTEAAGTQTYAQTSSGCFEKL